MMNYKILSIHRSQNWSTCAAMNQNYVLYYETQERAYNTECYQRFIEALLERLERQGIEGAYLIEDNVNFHKNAEVNHHHGLGRLHILINFSCKIKALIIAKGHHFDCLPPYSPFLNPIEELFSKWKSFIKRSDPKN